MRRKELIAAVLLGLAGFAGNWFKVELFFNTDFLFGSFFTMLALLRFGPAAGTTAAIVAGSCTYFLWNHPYAWIILTAETVSVALLTRGGGRDVLIADIAYWLVGGSVLIWLFYHLALGWAPLPTTLIAFKQGINGVCNTLAACAVSTALNAYRGRRRDELPSFRQVIFVSMASIVLFPAMALMIVTMRGEMRKGQEELARQTAALAKTEADSVGRWINEHQQSVKTLALLVSEHAATEVAAMQREVEILRASSLAFKRMGALSRDSVTIAYCPPRDETGKSTLGLDFSDRPYIPIMQATHAPYIADLVMGRIGKPAPMLPMVAPVIRGGEYDGFCIGVVNTSRLSGIMAAITVPHSALATLTDRQGAVVATTRGDLDMMDAYRLPENGETLDAGQGVSLWVPVLEKSANAMQRWRKSFLLKEETVAPEPGFKIVIETSLVPLLDRLTTQSITVMAGMSFLVVITIGFAQLFSERLVRSLAKLTLATEAIPQRFLAESLGQDIPEGSKIRELDALIANFRRMALALRDSFAKLKILNETLENRVASRTRELSTSEERFRALVEAAPAAIGVLDGQDRGVHFNRRFVELTGYTLADLPDLDAWTRQAYPDPDYRRDIVAKWRAAVDEGIRSSCPISPIEAVIVCKNGATRFVEVQTAVIGGLTMATFTDLTERETRRRELETAKDIAESGARSKSAFLASMSHEIRTPLNGIMGMLQLCLETDLSASQREHLEIALDAARRLLILLNDVLDLSRIEAGKMTVCVEPFQPQKIFHSMVSLFKDQSIRKNIPLLLDIDSGLPPVICGDEARLRQVLFNLIGNAFKFTESGSISVFMGALGPSAGQSRFKLLCVVSDTGPGIDDGMLGRLFTPFTQAEGGYARNHEGTGLGLSIVKRLVRLMHGEICLDTAPGRGTDVYFTVEVCAAPDAGRENSATTVQAASETDFEGVRVLIAEDETISLKFITICLKGLGLVCEGAADGNEVLDKLASGQFDLVLMDVQMPMLDGIETTRAIRASHRAYAGIPIIALTAHAMAGDREKCLAAGMDDYVAKPVETEDIKAAIRRVLAGGRGRMRQES
jgi:PAS domain S-box-containing protein